MADGLSVSRLINGTVNLSPQLARFPNFNTCLVLTDSDVIDTVTRIREYNSAPEVAADFGTAGPEYACAVLWFGQKPAPQTLLIGRWVKAASAGQLYCGPLAQANRVVGPWNAINNGAFKVTVNGVGPQEIGNLDFTGAANLNAVADTIESGFPGGTATCVYDAATSSFIITSTATGAVSAISFLTPPAAGTDISGMMAGFAASDGAYVAPGLDAQTALATFELFNNQFSNQFYGLVIPQASDADHKAVGVAVEASSPAHYYGITTAEADTLVPGNQTCLAAELKQIAGLDHTGPQYSSSSPYAIMSALARILTTNWQANNSTITLMYKSEPGVDAEQLTATQASAVQDKNCNVFVEYNNETAIIQYGQSSSGQFIDSVIGCDWLLASIQTALFNGLYGTKTKIPQTDAGMHILATLIDGVCQQAVNNGLLAPGVWNHQGFGQLQTGDYLSKGYYIYTPPVSSQSPEDRAKRKSVPFQIAAKLGGAVHTADFSIDVES